MQEDFRLIVDLVSVFAVAACGGMLAALLKQPVLLGYLVGGMIVGPTGLGLIREVVQVETLAQFGVAFLLFALGVEFSFSQLKKVKAIALGGGGLQIILTIITTVIVCGITGAWETLPAKGVFLGSILSLSSTAVVLKCLMERNETETTHAQVMLGILVIQDLALGLMLAILPALHQPGESIGLALFTAIVRIALFAAGAVVAGIWIMPRVLRFLARTESRELFLLGVVTLCLSIAILTEYLGLSIEMGAFVAGLMISEVEYADETLTIVEPLRDVFASLFFASIGMLIDPVFLWQNLDLILGLVALVFLGKFLIITPLVKLFRYPLKTALIAGLGLAQIGEFSFVLASEGQVLGLVSRHVYLLIVGTTAVTLMLTPFVLRVIPFLFNLVEFIPWLKPYLVDERAEDFTEDLPTKDHVVICGYGRIGQNLVRLLEPYQLPVVVIEQSESRIQQLRESGIPYVYGNAVSFHVLETAGVNYAKAMAIALPDPTSIRLCLKRALELSPELDLVVRATQDKNIEVLYQLGAKEVVQPEFEASLEMASHLLMDVGLGKEIIEQKMRQIRQDHYLDLRPECSAAQVSQHLQKVTQDLNRRWYDLPVNSPLIDMTLEELDMRRLIGVSLMAIRRADGTEIDYPHNGTRLQSGDRLLVVGADEELTALVDFAQGSIAVPGGASACQWVTVRANSPILGNNLADLIYKDHGIKVQAVRRDGKLSGNPTNIDLKVGDQVLLCGNLPQHYPEQVHQLLDKPFAIQAVSDIHE